MVSLIQYFLGTKCLNSPSGGKMTISKFGVGSLLVLGVAAAQPAFAASDVSNNQATANQAVASVAAPVASAQTASLIGAAVGNAIGGSIGGGGGFTVPAGGGFSPGGSGGFAPAGSGGGVGTPAPGPQSFNTRQIGAAAGSEPTKFGTWVNGTYSHLDKSEASLAMKGDIYNVVGGADYKFTDRLLGGMAVGYENVDITTSFNSGKYKGHGVTVAPYAGYEITPNWAADLSVGYSWLRYDTTSNVSTTGSFDATRWFASANLNGNYGYDHWVFQPKVGVMYLNEDQDGYTDSSNTANASSTIKFGRATAGSKIGYNLGMVTPFVKAYGQWDFKQPDHVLKANGQYSNIDDVGGVVGGGLDFLINDSVSGTVEGSYDSIGRSNLDTWTANAKIRVKF